ncbi:type I 3-dehydroquinate dehydratase [Candidatus Parcubacteria bacterium]|nr:type I 3-dehydroquinate dehydratase [Candidatus Parcubacteria bacterium]
MMKDKYCLPIIKNSKTEVWEMIEKNKKNYGFFEVWLDYIDELDNDFILRITKEYGPKLILTLRRKNLDAPKISSNRRREEILKLLANTKCMLDLDITQTEEIKLAYTLNMQKNLIISYHNYKLTPEDIYLEKIVDKIRWFKPNIIKVSTYCNSPQDSLHLIKIKRDFLENDEKHVVLGMGEHGKITRVFGALWGNELLYVPENTDEESAPGQISHAEMDKILNKINS